jgi:hypothetical protein
MIFRIQKTSFAHFGIIARRRCVFSPTTLAALHLQILRLVKTPNLCVLLFVTARKTKFKVLQKQ